MPRVQHDDAEPKQNLSRRSTDECVFSRTSELAWSSNELHVLLGSVGGNHAKQVSTPVPNSARAFPIRTTGVPYQKQKIMHCGPGGGSMGGGSMGGGSTGGSS